MTSISKIDLSSIRTYGDPNLDEYVKKYIKDWMASNGKKQITSEFLLAAGFKWLEYLRGYGYTMVFSNPNYSTDTFLAELVKHTTEKYKEAYRFLVQLTQIEKRTRDFYSHTFENDPFGPRRAV